jgi:succinate dehydrogenase / fumarate reductase cytochrome b subunit
VGFATSPIGYLLLFCWTVALWYHFCNGIRHLFWDAGHGFELPTVHASGATVLGATAVLTVLTWLAILVL